MNVTSPHEISQVDYLNFDAYTVVERNLWQRDRILVLDMHSLSESPKVALNLSKNTSKFLNKGDWCCNKGVNQAKAMPNNKVSMNPS
jgi:hypothetical protein